LKIPKLDPGAKKLFESLVPDDPRVKVRPMFGNVSAFVNGNMFMGAFGSGMFVRLPGNARDELLSEKGASVFEPMKGRQMKDYVMVPDAWTRQPAKIRPWVARSLDLIAKLSPKGK
jgi:TfoX/Sxy family transcriptional regulator of competence genes